MTSVLFTTEGLDLTLMVLYHKDKEGFCPLLYWHESSMTIFPGVVDKIDYFSPIES